MVGDLNGTPQGGAATYQTLVGAGFEDLGPLGAAPREDPGSRVVSIPTFRGARLERIDYIFARGPDAVSPRVHSMRLVGAGPFPGGIARLRPSDHAGLDANVSFYQAPMIE